MPGDCYYDCTNTPPGEPCYYVCDPDWWYNAYVPATDYRGNLTEVTSYADALNLTIPVTESRRYDITGNMVTASTSCCEQNTLMYTTSTYFAYPLSKTRGSATEALKQITTSATYDFNTGLPLTATDANGQMSQTIYGSATLRPQTVSLPSGAHINFSYSDMSLAISQTTYLQGTTIADQNVKWLNGRGQVRQEKAMGASGVWDLVDTVYDTMGQVTQQSLPYRSGDTVQWSTTVYDKLGRVENYQTLM